MEKKQIVCRRVDFKGLTAFWKEVNEAYAEGYTYNEDGILMQEVPRVHGIVRVTLSKIAEIGVVDEVVVESPELEVETISEETPDEELEESKEVILEGEVAKSVEGLFEDLDKLTKKKELLEYAESFGIEVSEDIKQPAAIKKHIKEQLSN